MHSAVHSLVEPQPEHGGDRKSEEYQADKSKNVSLIYGNAQTQQSIADDIGLSKTRVCEVCSENDGPDKKPNKPDQRFKLNPSWPPEQIMAKLMEKLPAE